VLRDGVDDLLRLDARAVEVSRTELRIGVDLLRLSAHELVEVLRLRADALRVLDEAATWSFASWVIRSACATAWLCSMRNSCCASS
jgi:hypothetical protein